MFIDGGQLKYRVLSELKHQVEDKNHGLHVVFVTFNQAQGMWSYIQRITKNAESVGIGVDVERIPSLQHKTGVVLHNIIRLTKDHDAICLELPLPHKVDADSVQRLFPLTHDVMVYGDMAMTQFREQRLSFNPPAVDALIEVVKHLSLHVAGMNVTVVGKGRTIGVPIMCWLRSVGANVTVVDTGEDIEHAVYEAQVVIAGMDEPGLIQPNMLSANPVLIDMGAREIGNQGAGDIDPLCVDVATTFASATGVMQPLCRLMTLRNTFAVAQMQQRQHVTPIRAEK